MSVTSKAETQYFMTIFCSRSIFVFKTQNLEEFLWFDVGFRTPINLKRHECIDVGIPGIFLSVARVLLRVRMLYYLKVEVLGEAANQAQEGVPARYAADKPLYTHFSSV